MAEIHGVPSAITRAEDLRGRGLMAVNAMSSPRNVSGQDFETLIDGMEKFKAKHDARYTVIEAALDEMAKGSALHKLGYGGGNAQPRDPEYTAAFTNYFRRGTSEDDLRQANANGDLGRIHAAMSTGSPADGGYLAPVEWDRTILQALRPVSPMRQLADVVSTTVGAYSTVWNNQSWGTGWVGETAARPATSTPQLSQIVYRAGEIYANPAITQVLLDDAQFDAIAWLTGEVDTEFGRQEGIAFISGDGVNKPYGLLQYVTGGAAESHHPGGVLTVVPSGNAAAIPNVDVLIDFMYGLPSPYRANAAWLMNSTTAAIISKMKNSDGDLIWRESLIVGQPATLLGRPVVLDENMPAVAAGSLPIAFGDFKTGYVINDRVGTRILRDPYTNKPFVHFYATRRVGAGVRDPNAIRLMKIAAS